MFKHESNDSADVKYIRIICNPQSGPEGFDRNVLVPVNPDTPGFNSIVITFMYVN
jgi:hypothetical protein